MWRSNVLYAADAIPRASDVPISPPLPDSTGGVSTLPLVPSLPLTSNCLPPAPMQPYQHMKSSRAMEAQSNGGTDSGPASGGECVGKAEIRRARRCVQTCPCLKPLQCLTKACHCSGVSTEPRQPHESFCIACAKGDNGGVMSHTSSEKELTLFMLI